MMPIIAPPSISLAQALLWAEGLSAADVFVRSMVPALYIEALVHGIDPAVMVAQSAHETGFGKFGRAVTPQHFNTCGLKIRNPSGPDDNPHDHARFASWRIGARAHAHHLRAYCGLSVPEAEELSPRAVWVRQASLPIRFVEQLGGRWAPRVGYGESIVALAQSIQAVQT